MLLYVALHAKRDTKNGRGKYSQLQSDQGFPSYFPYLASLCSIVFPSFMCSFSSSGGGSLDNYTVGSADSAVKPLKSLVRIRLMGITGYHSTSLTARATGKASHEKKRNVTKYSASTAMCQDMSTG